MRHLNVVSFTLLLAVALTGASMRAHAGEPLVRQKCLAGKTKCVSKEIDGLLKCAERCQKNPKHCGAKQAECEAKVRFTFERPDRPEKGCFEKLEDKQDVEKFETRCITTDDTDTMGAQIDALAEELVRTLEGDPPPVCGDGVINGNESCDGSALAGADCTTLGYVTGTLGCTAGCGYDTTACAVPCDVSAASVGGGCWYYGGPGESCDTVCANEGRLYDDLTRTFAGSDGTSANCDHVLAKLATLGAPVPIDVNGSGDVGAGGDTLGCTTDASPSHCPELVDQPNTCWKRYRDPTTSTASQSGWRRACACMERISVPD